MVIYPSCTKEARINIQKCAKNEVCFISTTRDLILSCMFIFTVSSLIRTTLFNLRFTLEPVWGKGSICAPVKKGGWGQRENKGDSWVAHVTDGVNVTRTDCILIARLHTIRLGSLWPYRRAKLLKIGQHMEGLRAILAKKNICTGNFRLTGLYRMFSHHASFFIITLEICLQNIYLFCAHKSQKVFFQKKSTYADHLVRINTVWTTYLLEKSWKY